MNDDLISRQALIEAINAERKWLHFNVNHANHHYHMMNENSRIIGIVWNLPSIQPEQKTGQWISNRHTDTVLCSECKKCYGDESKFCPNCGAKMKRESEDYKNNE